MGSWAMRVIGGGGSPYILYILFFIMGNSGGSMPDMQGSSQFQPQQLCANDEESILRRWNMPVQQPDRCYGGGYYKYSR